MNRYNCNGVDLLGIKNVHKVRNGLSLRYMIAYEQVAYSPTRLVAWQGRYTNPDTIARQQSCETEKEFTERFHQIALWK